MFCINKSTNASIICEIIISPKAINEYFSGLAKVESAKKGMYNPLVKPSCKQKVRKNIGDKLIVEDNCKRKAVDAQEEIGDNIEPKINEVKKINRQDGTLEDKKSEYGDEFKQMNDVVSHVVDTADFMNDVTNESKDEMKRVIPNIIDMAVSIMKNMRPSTDSEV